MKRKENLEKRRKFYILAILVMVLLITSVIAVVKLSNGEFKPGILNFNSVENKEVEEENINLEEQETEESDSKETTTKLVSSLNSSKTGIFSLSNPANISLSSPELTEGEGTNAATTNLAESVDMESIVQGFRDTDLDDGDYEVNVNGETYKVELINYKEDVHYTTSNPTVSLGDSTTQEYKTLVVKYHKNLEIDKGVTVKATSYNNGSYTYKKGMYICVLGELINRGTITATARGTYNCEGQDMFLWKRDDGIYEKVPASGLSGGTANKYTSSKKTNANYYLNGNSGSSGSNSYTFSGSNRATGGGGSGALNTRRADNTYTATSGAGAYGTSFSGGSGGGAIDINYGGTRSAGDGLSNGRAGGNAFAARSNTSYDQRGAGGGAGNTGGSGYLTDNSAPKDTVGTYYSSYNGNNGTGGLLIIYSNALTNVGTISSNGSAGGSARYAGGGGSGGGSVNIFSECINMTGIVTATGGSGGSGAQVSGGAGGNGSVTIIELQKYGLSKSNEYIRINEMLDLNVVNRKNLNDSVSQSGYIWTSSNPDVAVVNSNGLVIGRSIGRTTITAKKGDIKVKAIINVYRNNPRAITVPQAEEGKYFSVVLKEDGTVWTTGYNEYGKLGQGNTIDVNIPMQVKINQTEYLTNVRKISVGNTHVLALTEDGEVYAWGNNGNYQLGQGNTTNLYYATKMRGIGGSGYISGVIDIAAGYNTSYVLLNNGLIYGVGYGGYYQIGTSTGNYSYLTKVVDKNNEIDMSSVIAITAGYYNLGCITSDSQTLVKGYNENGALGTGDTSTMSYSYYLGNDINEIILGGNSGAIIKEDGTVWTAGYNGQYQLGLGDAGSHYEYVKVKFKDKEDQNGNTIVGEDLKAKYVSMSYQNLSAIGKDNKAYVAGYNGAGQLSNGTTNNNMYPETIKNAEEKEIENILFVKSGAGESSNYSKNIIYVKEDGTVWVAGDNTKGQVGNGTNTSTNYAAKMGDGFVNYPNKNIELEINETETIDKSLFEIEDDINVFIDGIAQLNNITLTIEDSNIAELSNTGVVTGKVQGRTKIIVEDSIAGIKTYIWVKVTDGKRVDIDTGNKFTIALKQDGSVWTWGYNNVGQLGLGNKTTYKEPQKVTGIPERIKDVAAGNNHALALTEGGEIYAWGARNYGQVGDGYKTNTPRTSPIKLGGGN